VDIVHSLGLGSGNTVLGLLRIPHVSGSSQYFQGQECSSSPTSGTVFSLVRGEFALTCVQNLIRVALTGWAAGCSLAAAGPVQVCGVAGSSLWLVGLPPAVSGFLRFLVPVMLSRPVVAYTYSWAGGAGTT
jgi:hypothetical protein